MGQWPTSFSILPIKSMANILNMAAHLCTRTLCVHSLLCNCKEHNYSILRNTSDVRSIDLHLALRHHSDIRIDECRNITTITAKNNQSLKKWQKDITNRQ